MVKKLNNTGRPIFVEGRLIPTGTFYDAVEENNGGNESPTKEAGFLIPKIEDVTVTQMKEKFDEWGVDLSTNGKDKATVYALFIEEARKRGGIEPSDTTG